MTTGAVVGALVGVAALVGLGATAFWIRRRQLRKPKLVDNNPVFEDALIGDAQL
jgi:uncharacterized protein YneF (UPF0154 family)